LGCGWGRGIIGLIESGEDRQYVGLDFSRKMLTAGKRLMEQLLYSSKVCFVQADAEYLPFFENEFASVISIRLLQHVARPRVVIRECKRVVKEGGTITVILPNRLNPYVNLFYYTRSYTPFEAKRWFQANGLKLRTVRSIGFIPSKLHRFSYNSKILYFEKFCEIAPMIRLFGPLTLVSGQKTTG
jgi:ubiquinone/menaquinone biosynthesis C-methylase UbiE